jgi:hypothetical protein
MKRVARVTTSGATAAGRQEGSVSLAADGYFREGHVILFRFCLLAWRWMDFW